MEISDATKGDAADLADLINLAGEGIPAYLWAGMAEPGQSPQEVGIQRASREEGGFSYRNARIIRETGKVSGMIISYQLEDPYSLDDLEEYPEVVRPLVLLEAKAPGSWYINAVATKEHLRGRGVASHLIRDAESVAHAKGAQNISLIVASENSTAKKLYVKLGYETVDALPVVDFPGALHGGDWELMIKPLL